MQFRPVARSLFVAIAFSSTACLPYSMGRTAQTVPVGERSLTSTYWILPNGLGFPDDSIAPNHTFSGADAEVRWGIDSRSDFGLRAPTATGIVLSYKRRVRGAAHQDSAAIAWQAGTGFVNLGNHAIVELSLLASTRKRGIAAWYGGVRAMQVAPLSEAAVHDRPSLGGLLGVRLSIGDAKVVPELAVYHDESALRLRTGRIIFVPSVSLENITFPRVMMLR